jgi:hypothetical protein
LVGGCCLVVEQRAKKLGSKDERGRDRDTGHMQCKSILIFIPSTSNVSHVRRLRR